MSAVKAYAEDLAYIHDEGFSEFSLNASRGLIRLFKKYAIPGTSVVELGCGPGRLAHVLTRKGYSVWGVDASRAMIALARYNAPKGKFSVGSAWRTKIPLCAAVISVGEVLNYQFDGSISESRLRALTSRIYASLRPKGLFVFDVLCRRDTGKVIHSRIFTETRQWLVAVDKIDAPGEVLRYITLFRRKGEVYRKSVEVHSLRRYDLKRLVSILRGVGFTVRSRSGYDRRPLGPGHVVIIARKPG